ncbi:unnamed protein product [Protopolystoma xenopodis]|uniref:Uncharacterized protein n=1 Tax=Protopolystoma xenopodis TaxID=117903 RepID=A0A448WYG3_9PLAT|nr:unnamed protein product [Protopolystoma xenopodis]
MDENEFCNDVPVLPDDVSRTRLRVKPHQFYGIRQYPVAISAILQSIWPCWIVDIMSNKAKNPVAFRNCCHEDRSQSFHNHPKVFKETVCSKGCNSTNLQENTDTHDDIRPSCRDSNRGLGLPRFDEKNAAVSLSRTGFSISTWLRLDCTHNLQLSTDLENRDIKSDPPDQSLQEPSAPQLNKFGPFEHSQQVNEKEANLIHLITLDGHIENTHPDFYQLGSDGRIVHWIKLSTKVSSS